MKHFIFISDKVFFESTHKVIPSLSSGTTTILGKATCNTNVAK